MSGSSSIVSVDKTAYVTDEFELTGPEARDAGITVSGDAVTIPANVILTPVGVIDIGSKYIVLDGGTVQGRNAGLDGFISTATDGVIRSTGGTVVLRDFLVVAPAGPALKLDGSEINGDIAKVIMVGAYSSPIGFDLTGFSVPSITSCFVGQFPGFPAPAIGVKVSGSVGKVHVQDTPFFATTDAALVLDAGAVIQQIDLAGNFYETDPGVNLIRAEAGYTLVDIAEIDRNVPRGAPDPSDVLNGVDKFDPKWNFNANPAIPDSKAVGSFQQDPGWETTVISASNTPVKADVTVTGSEFNQRYTVSADGTLTYTGIRPRTAKVSVSGHLDTALNGQEIRVSVRKDGVYVPGSAVTAKITTGGDQRSFATSCIVFPQAPGDHAPAVGSCTLEVYVENLTSDDDILIRDLSMDVLS